MKMRHEPNDKMGKGRPWPRLLLRAAVGPTMGARPGEGDVRGSDLAGRIGTAAVAGMVALAVAAGVFLAFLRLGFGTGAAALLVAAIGLGGGIDLPLGRGSGRVGVNVGGGLVPL